MKKNIASAAFWESKEYNQTTQDIFFKSSEKIDLSSRHFAGRSSKASGQAAKQDSIWQRSQPKL